MPTLTATPNPVGIFRTSTSADSTTTVHWDTEVARPGFVDVSENGQTPKPLGGGARSGDVTLPVTLGSSYRLSLKMDPLGGGGQKIEVATTTVATYDIRQQLAAGFSQAFVPQLGMPSVLPQLITNLIVQPGVDTVRISFRTNLPTIPTTELRDENGNWVDGRMPLFGGPRTLHEVEFGFDKALALDKKHSFKIEAFGPTGDPVSPNKTVCTGEFVTGTRNVDVMFEVIQVLDDSDSGGVGEFSITFGVGDVETGAALGNPQSWIGDLDDDDPPRDLGKIFSLTNAHRSLWLEVIADEDDKGFGFASGLSARGSRPSFEGAGGKFTDDGSIQRADLTIVVDVGTDPGRFMIPFEMRTGDWPVKFVINGHLGVHAFAGAVISTKMAKSKLPFSRSTFLTSPGKVIGLSADGSGTRAEAVALGSDGAIYHRILAPYVERRRDGGDWARIESPGHGMPAVVASDPDALDLVDLDGVGGVIHCQFDPANPKRVKWRNLKGKFVSVIPVADSARRKGVNGGLTLFGIAEDGGLHVHNARSEGPDWDRVGDELVRTAAAIDSTPGALIAVSTDGALVHVARRNGRWRLQAIGGKVPNGASVRSLMVATLHGGDVKGSTRVRQDLFIGMMDDARQVRMLRWSDYPEGAPESRWQELGTLQDLLFAEDWPKRGRKPARKEKQG